MAAPVLSNLRAHTAPGAALKLNPCTQQTQISFRNSLWEQKAKPKEAGDPERKEKNNYTITTGRECNRHQVISQLEDLGVNHSNNLIKAGINDKKQESSSSGTQ